MTNVDNVDNCDKTYTNMPKAQCKVCLSYWDVGIVYCTCGHFLRDGTEENKKYIKYTLDLFFDFQLLYQERATPPPPLREERRGSRVLHREFAQEEMQEERFLGAFTIVFIRDARFRKTMIELGRTEEVIS